MTSPLAILTNLNSRFTSPGTSSSPCHTSPSVQDNVVAVDVSHELTFETTEMLWPNSTGVGLVRMVTVFAAMAKTRRLTPLPAILLGPPT